MWTAQIGFTVYIKDQRRLSSIRSDIHPIQYFPDFGWIQIVFSSLDKNFTDNEMAATPTSIIASFNRLSKNSNFLKFYSVFGKMIFPAVHESCSDIGRIRIYRNMDSAVMGRIV